MRNKKTHVKKSITLIASCTALALLSLSPAHSRSLKIVNETGVKLEELVIVSKEQPVKIRMTIARDLAAGTRIKTEVPNNICLVDIQGRYEDKSSIEAEDLDLCRRHTLHLVQ